MKPISEMSLNELLDLLSDATHEINVRRHADSDKPVIVETAPKRPLRVLVGCECSGIVRQAFRDLGHEAYSADLLPAEDHSPHHIICDHDLHLLDIIAEWEGKKWDMGIFHPQCKRLANSGVLRLYKHGKKVNGIDPEKWEELKRDAAFFKVLWNCLIPKVCVENSIQHFHAKKIIGVEQTQTIQPYEFGHPESKRTCLWLKNLPLLQATNVLELPECGHWENQTPSGQNKLGPSKHRAADRARTYKGIAEAMAMQWGGKI